MDGTDAAMIELGQHQRFATEALNGVLIDQVGVQQFDRHATIERLIDSLIDGTHTAPADLLDDAVLTDGLPNHIQVDDTGPSVRLQANSAKCRRAIYDLL